MPTPKEITNAVKVIEEVAHQFGIRDAFFVGGYPRSIAMGFGLTDVHDLDVATGTPQKATQLAGFVEEQTKAASRLRHRTSTVTLDFMNVEVDFQGSSSHDHVMPYLHAIGVSATPVATNIFDRDFTINSLAIPVGSHGKKIIDLTKRAIPDIEAKRIATILPASEVVVRNPLVITRAIRFAHKYNFAIDGLLWQAMLNNAKDLQKKLSHERLVVEAHVLSKYDVSDMLKELGLEYLKTYAGEFNGQE